MRGLAYLKSKFKRIAKTLMAHSHNSSDDVIIVPQRRVACDGDGGALGHPKIYLDMGTDTSVRCKYCDRIFVLDKNAVDDGH